MFIRIYFTVREREYLQKYINYPDVDVARRWGVTTAYARVVRLSVVRKLAQNYLMREKYE